MFYKRGSPPPSQLREYKSYQNETWREDSTSDTSPLTSESWGDDVTWPKNCVMWRLWTLINDFFQYYRKRYRNWWPFLKIIRQQFDMTMSLFTWRGVSMATIFWLNMFSKLWISLIFDINKIVLVVFSKSLHHFLIILIVSINFEPILDGLLKFWKNSQIQDGRPVR